MKWIKERQIGLYEKLKLFSFSRMDCYLIRYAAGCAVDWHQDLVKNHKHYRFNVYLKGPNRMQLAGNPRKRKRIDFFRADHRHCMALTYQRGLILSFGFIIKKRKNHE